MSNFKRYSAYYDLLYRNKDYNAEAEYVAQLLRAKRPDAKTVLEFGSGTGRHGQLLAAKGFKIHGIERSADMVAIARANMQLPEPDCGNFSCEVGDICEMRLNQRFDAVIALFHVMSYLTTNDSLRAAFRTAAYHLTPRGIFLFDVWHGPAVLTERPSRRVREVTDGGLRVTRTASPFLDTNLATVNVVYDLECENVSAGEKVQIREEHLMRYLFPTEIGMLADECGLTCVKTEEFLTGNAPSPATWSVAYLLKLRSIA